MPYQMQQDDSAAHSAEPRRAEFDEGFQPLCQFKMVHERTVTFAVDIL
jgi:hypothetical protein